TFHANGRFTYTPNQRFVGSDSFTFTWTDRITMGNTATVWIDAYNNAPVALDVQYSVLHDTELRGQLSGYDADGENLAAQLVSFPLHGTVALNSDGTFTYTPNQGYVGGDVFTYVWTDGVSTSNIATVQISIYNQTPRGYDDSITVAQGATFTGSLRGYDPDGDLLVAELVESPAHGDLVLSANGNFSYTPSDGFVGVDQFLYRWTDGIAFSSAIHVQIYVVGSDPFAMPDSYFVPPSGNLLVADPSLGLLGNDHNPDGEVLSVEFVEVEPEYDSLGQIQVHSDGTFYFVAGPAWNPGAQFVFHYGFQVAGAVLMAKVILIAQAGAVDLTLYRPQNAHYAPTKRDLIPVREEWELDPGSGIRWNNDDDANGVHDRWQADLALREDDLVKIDLDIHPWPNRINLRNVRYELEISNDNIRVWRGQIGGRDRERLLLGKWQLDDPAVLKTNLLPKHAQRGLFSYDVEWIVAPDQAANNGKTVITWRAVETTSGQVIC
ncbi:MAG: Ig-like domain-containing protein, partial [Gemmatales bacterium]|nr:Ig-like domain-containing protein [Gemmatales bacterium]MDW8176574.1 Ig-like domain-containing protein [Gemmatales bacterium]